MNIYVGSMSFQTTEHDLRAAFEAHGTVSSARIVVSRPGRSRGFGFVEMPNQGEARGAMDAMNGAELDGRILEVNEAREQRDRRRGRSEC